MIVSVDSLRIAGFDRAIFCRLERFPTCITQNYLQFTGNPNFYLLFPIVAFLSAKSIKNAKFVCYMII